MWSARAKAREANRGSPFYCSIDLAGLLAVVLVLLVIFMADVQPFHGISADLPAARHASPLPHARREDAIRIVVSRDGRIFFGQSAINPTDLPNRIREALLHGSERRAYLSVDARAQYADVAVVVDQVRLAGVQKVTFLAELGPASTFPMHE